MSISIHQIIVDMTEAKPILDDSLLITNIEEAQDELNRLLAIARKAGILYDIGVSGEIVASGFDAKDIYIQDFRRLIWL